MANHGPPNHRQPGHAVFSNSEWRGIAKSLSLSHRECEIARAIFDDASEETIARRLNISRHTVHTHFTFERARNVAYSGDTRIAEPWASRWQATLALFCCRNC